MGRFLEIAVGGALADPQTARGKNFFVGITGRARDFQRDELVGIDCKNLAAAWWLLGSGG